MNRTGLAAALLVSTAVPVCAADIRVSGNKIYYLGTTEHGDYAKFLTVTQEIHGKDYTVVIYGGGGMTIPAMATGKWIRLQGWATECEYVCASSGALIWLAGVRRYGTEHAYVGFHSMRDYYTKKRVDNAIVQTYLTQLGYGPDVFKFATETDAIRYMTDAQAHRLGLTYVTVHPSIQRAALAHINIAKRPDPPPRITVSHAPGLATELSSKAEELRLLLQPHETPARPVPSVGDRLEPERATPEHPNILTPELLELGTRYKKQWLQ